MIEGEEILNSLRWILEESRRYKDVDAAIDSVANRGKRISLVEGIQVVEAGLDDLWSRRYFLPILQTTTLVRSRKDPTGRITLTFEGDSHLIFNFNEYGLKALAEADSAYERYLDYDEFKQRLRLLKERILLGGLDGFLVFGSEDVIHKVMGFSGELLKLIGIDPSHGETYRRFLKECEPKEPIPNGVGTVAEVVQKILENYKAKKKAEGDVAIGIPSRDRRNDDVAEGIPTRPISKIQREKNPAIKKAKIIRICTSSQLPKKASKNDSEDSNNEKNKKSED